MRKIRMKDRIMDSDLTKAVLTNCEYGVLSTVDNDGQPYGVPVNYVYKNDCIYFHGSRLGHKVENIENNPKVSFCAIGNTKLLPSQFDSEYESVVAFGVASELQGAERDNALFWILEKYSPEFMEEGKTYTEKMIKAVKVFKIEVNHLTGKKAIEES